jgi:hypothetical protein
MAELVRQQALYLAIEGSFQGTPGAYVAVPAEELGEPGDGKEILETAYATGRPFRTAHEMSPSDLWTLSFKTPVVGLASGAGDGVSAGSVSADWLDMLLANVHGDAVNTSGEAVAAGATTSNLILAAAAALADQDIACVANATRAQWRQVTDDATDPTLAIAPDWGVAPVDTDILYGARRYAMSSPQLGGGDPATDKYLRGHLVLGGAEYNLRGGYVTGLSLAADVNKRLMLSWSLSGVTKVEGSVAVGVDPLAAPATTPIKLQKASIHHGATSVDTSSFSLDWGLAAEPVMSSVADQGIVGWKTTAFDPKVSVKPLFADSWTALKRAGTSGLLVAQFGVGAVSGGVVNSCAMALADAQSDAADPAAEGAIRRNAVNFVGADRVNWDTGTAARYFQFLRA